MGRLENKVALISGGARGLGRAMAEEFVAEGARVVIGDVLEKTAAETARIRSAVATARAIQTAANSQRRTADLEGGTMAVASGAIPFIARQMYRISLADKAERMFFTPQGQKALREAEELMTTGKKMSAAATGWWMSEATEGM